MSNPLHLDPETLEAAKRIHDLEETFDGCPHGEPSDVLSTVGDLSALRSDIRTPLGMFGADILFVPTSALSDQPQLPLK